MEVNYVSISPVAWRSRETRTAARLSRSDTAAPDFHYSVFHPMGLFNCKKREQNADEPVKEKGAWRKPGSAW